MIRFAVVLMAVAVSACGGEPQNDPLDLNLGAATQALNARGWDYVTNGLDTSWQFKNGTGPCATAAGNVVTTAACATNDTAQHWEIFVKADGKYEICRPGTLVNPVGKVALLLNPDGPASFVASQYWAAAVPLKELVLFVAWVQAVFTLRVKWRAGRWLELGPNSLVLTRSPEPQSRSAQADPDAVKSN